MSIRKSLGWALALAAMALPAAARAEQVVYTTAGVFSATGLSEYTDAAGHSISYVSSGTQFVDLSHGASQANFGQFDTSATTTATGNTPIGGTFTLTIFQLAPDPSPASNMLTFVGSLSGTLYVNSSQSYVQFDPTALTGSIGDVLYSIVSADGNHPGRVNLNPFTTQLGISNINGSIDARAVPEPSTLVLMGLGAPALLAARYRRKRDANVAA
jgi:hypothetical protein